MKTTLSSGIGVLFFISALAAQAQTFVHDDTVPFATNSYRATNDYVVGEVTFNNQTGTSTDPYSVNPVGMKQTEATLEDGSTRTFWDVCAQLFVGPTGTSTLDVASRFGALDSTQEGRIRALYSNALPQFITATETLSYSEASVLGSAIQLALWDLIEDSGGTAQSLDETNPDSGLLSVNVAQSDGGDTLEAVNQAEAWLGNIDSGTWTDQGGLNYFYGSSAEQDRLWVSVIPEPSTALLGLLGMVCLLRRSRR